MDCLKKKKEYPPRFQMGKNKSMKKILFVCHGNICRSVTAEFVFKHLIKLNNLESKYYVESRATTREEIGNDIYPPMKRTLINNGISVSRHYATQITLSDYKNFDLILLMDEENMYGIKRIIPEDYLKKIHLKMLFDCFQFSFYPLIHNKC